MKTLDLPLALAISLILCGCNDHSPTGAVTKITPSEAGASPESSAEGQRKLLRITATVDGSGRLIFTQQRVSYEHKFWDMPTNVTFDGEPWIDLNETPAVWKDLGTHLDLRKARIIKREARDVIALEQTPDGFDLYLSDSPNGEANYDVTIAIPRCK